jgi:hypothetical protein
MSRKPFKVTIQESCSYTVMVLAEDTEEAREIAQRVDSKLWSSNQDYEVDHDAEPLIDESEAQNRLIYGRYGPNPHNVEMLGKLKELLYESHQLEKS